MCFVTRDQKGEVVMTSYLPYEDILNWECTPTTTSLTLSLGTRREVLDLKCEQSSEVERLLRDYTGILAASSEWARCSNYYYYYFGPKISHFSFLLFRVSGRFRTTRPRIRRCCRSARAM